MAIKKVLKRTQNNRGLNTIPVTHKTLNRWSRAGKVTPQLPGDPRLLLSEYSATLDMWPPPLRSGWLFLPPPSHQHSSQQEARTWEREVCSFPLGVWPGYCTHHFHLYPINQNVFI